jgi:hypothetical protein
MREEVADRPRKQRSLGIAGAAEEEGRGGKIVYRTDDDLAFQGLDAGYPQASRLVVLLRLLLVVALEFGFFVGQRWSRLSAQKFRFAK